MKKTWLALLLILALLLTACGEKAPAWQEQYDLGIRYLSEGNYAEAIIAFTAAIQIDPKQETVYLALSEAYAASGNIEKAAETLRQAIAQLGETEELALALDYAERGVVHTERQENPDGSYSIYEFDANGRQIRTTYYNPDGSVSGVDEYEYDANGSTLRSTYYNSDGSVRDTVEYEHDADYNVIRATWYNPDGSVRKVEEFGANRKLIRITFYNADGSVDYVCEYDTNGNLFRSTYYNPDGSVEAYSEFEYSADGRAIRTTFYNPDGSVDFYTEDDYDADGRIIRTVFYKPDGTVKDVMNYN